MKCVFIAVRDRLHLIKAVEDGTSAGSVQIELTQNGALDRRRIVKSR